MSELQYGFQVQHRDGALRTAWCIPLQSLFKFLPLRAVFPVHLQCYLLDCLLDNMRLIGQLQKAGGLVVLANRLMLPYCIKHMEHLSVGVRAEQTLSVQAVAGLCTVRGLDLPSLEASPLGLLSTRGWQLRSG